MSLKKIILLSGLLLLCLGLMAQEADSLENDLNYQKESYGFTELMKLSEVSEITKIPLDSLRIHFKLNKNDSRLAQRTLKFLKLEPEAIVNYQDIRQYGYDQTLTLKEVSQKNHLPIKKLIEYLKLNPRDKSLYQATLKDLHVRPADIDIIVKDFKENLPQFGAILTVLGMSVVFFSLILTALIISQLVHVGKTGKQEHKHGHSVQTPVGKVTAKKHEDLSTGSVIAVITAIHLRMQELEEENKLMLTWRRANVSMWQASGKVQFPNFKYTQNRK